MLRPAARFAVAVVAVLSLAAGARAVAALTIDPMTTAFPPNVHLPATQPSLLFVGAMCDGAACPPGSVVTQILDDVSQAGLPGVIGGSRRADLQLMLAQVQSRLDPVARTLSFEPGSDGQGSLRLRYGTAGLLRADFTADGSTGIEFDLRGDMSPPGARTVATSLLIASHVGEPGETSVIRSWTTHNPGTVRFAFADYPGIDFRQVDVLVFQFHEILDHGLAFTIGPIATYSEATPARRSTWGRLKALYR